MITTRGVAGFVGASLVALVASLAMSSAVQAKPACGPSHARTLTSNTFARVYAEKGKVYVCLKSNGRTTLLKGANPRCQTGPNVYVCDRFALGGKWVAWTRSNPSDVDVNGGIVTVMYMPTRSIDHRWYPSRDHAEIYKIVVLSDGAAAWAESVSDGGGGAFAVGAFGTDLQNHAIDRLDTCGSDPSTTASCYIDPSSLQVLPGKTVGWRYSADGQQPATIDASHTMY